MSLLLRHDRSKRVVGLGIAGLSAAAILLTMLPYGSMAAPPEGASSQSSQLAGAKRLAEMVKNGVPSMEKTINLAKEATRVQAELLGASTKSSAGPSPDLLPSEALKKLLDRHSGVHVGRETDQIRTLDLLPAPVRSSLAGVIDSFVGLGDAARSQFEAASHGADSAALQRLLAQGQRLSRDEQFAAKLAADPDTLYERTLSSFAAEDRDLAAKLLFPGGTDPKRNSSEAGKALGPVFSARLRLLDQVGNLARALASTPQSEIEKSLSPLENNSADPAGVRPELREHPGSPPDNETTEGPVSLRLAQADIPEEDSECQLTVTLPPGPFNFRPAGICIDLREDINNTYEADYSLLIDAGGDDLYANNGGGNGGGAVVAGPATALIDLRNGDDKYVNSCAKRNGQYLWEEAGALVATKCRNDGVNGGAAGGFGTTAFLFDSGGGDLYVAGGNGANGGAGGTSTGGSSLGLVSGSLIDGGGKDKYVAAGNGTNGGVAHILGVGAGFLFDAESENSAQNDDVYAAVLDENPDDAHPPGSRGANGGGGPFVVGSGFLVDSAGRDYYTAGNLGTNGGAAGGALQPAGFLLDVAGDEDSYRAGSGGVNGGGVVGTLGAGRGLLLDSGGRGDTYFDQNIPDACNGTSDNPPENPCRDWSVRPKGTGAQLDSTNLGDGVPSLDDLTDVVPDPPDLEEVVESVPDPNEVLENSNVEEDLDSLDKRLNEANRLLGSWIDAVTDPEENEDSEEPPDPTTPDPDSSDSGPEVSGGGMGALFVTGHGADAAAGKVGCALDCAGPKNFLRKAVAYVTPGKQNLRLLYVLGNYQSYANAAGMEAAGFARCPASGPMGCFDLALNKDKYPDNFNAVNLRQIMSAPGLVQYDAIVVGTDQRILNMDVLHARKQQLFNYVNGGGGLVALPQNLSYAQCDPGALHEEFRACYGRSGPGSTYYQESLRFLPFMNQRPLHHGCTYWTTPTGKFIVPHGPDSTCGPDAFVVTPQGLEVGLSPSDPNTSGGSTWYPCVLDHVFTRHVDGRITSTGTRHKTIPPNPPQTCAKVNDESANEGNSGTTPLVFTVSLDRSDIQRKEPILVKYATVDGTARGAGDCSGAGSDGADYVSSSGAFTFEPGNILSKTITVQLCGDGLAEPDENFLLKLTGSEGLRVTAIGTVLNDDAGARSSSGEETLPPGAGADRTVSQAGPPAQPAVPVSVPAAAPAPAVAFAPAAAPASAAQTAGSQAQAQAQSQAQAQAQASSGAQVQVPQFGIAMDKERQSQAEKAYIDGVAPQLEELLASERRPGAASTLAVVIGATMLSLGMGIALRRSQWSPNKENQILPHDDEDLQHWLAVRRLRSQR